MRVAQSHGTRSTLDLWLETQLENGTVIHARRPLTQPFLVCEHDSITALPYCCERRRVTPAVLLQSCAFRECLSLALFVYRIFGALPTASVRCTLVNSV